MHPFNYSQFPETTFVNVFKQWLFFAYYGDSNKNEKLVWIQQKFQFGTGGEGNKSEAFGPPAGRALLVTKGGNGREIQKVGRWGFAYTFATTHTESVLALPVKNTDKFKFFGSNVMYMHIRVNNIFVNQGIGKLWQRQTLASTCQN